MYTCQVNPNRRPAYVSVAVFALCAVILMSTHLFGQKAYLVIPQVLALICFTVAIMITNRYLLTNYLYEIEEAPNKLSDLPKLNIYGSRGHNFGHQFYCLPVDHIERIERFTGGSEKNLRTINACGSMFPKERYLVRYDCDGKIQGIYLECTAEFARTVQALVDRYAQKGTSDL